jgi:hypothetical protein
MPDLTAKRTLVKSPPELWEELSAIEGLTKHLGAFGEIKITKLEPEHTVAWEGEHASGTVSIEPSGWGTRVTLHAELPEAAEPEPAEPETAAPQAVEPEAAKIEVEPAPQAEPVVEEPPARRRGFLAWLFRTRTAEQLSLAVESEAEPEPIPAEPVTADTEPTPADSVPASAAAGPAPEAIEVSSEPLEAEPEPEPVRDESEDLTIDPDRARLVLDEALDALGAAHHRPFSRG